MKWWKHLSWLSVGPLSSTQSNILFFFYWGVFSSCRVGMQEDTFEKLSWPEGPATLVSSQPPPAFGQTHHHNSTGSNPSVYSAFPYTFWDALEELKMKIILKNELILSWKQRTKVNKGSHLTKSRKEVTGSSTGPILLFMLYQNVFYLHFSRKYTILQKRRKFFNIL